MTAPRIHDQALAELAVRGFTRYMRTAELYARPVDGGRYEVVDVYNGMHLEDATLFESTAINQEGQVFDFSLALALLNSGVSVRRRAHTPDISIRLTMGCAAWWVSNGQDQSPVTSWAPEEVMAKDWEVAP